MLVIRSTWPGNSISWAMRESWSSSSSNWGSSTMTLALLAWVFRVCCGFLRTRMSVQSVYSSASAVHTRQESAAVTVAFGFHCHDVAPCTCISISVSLLDSCKTKFVETQGDWLKCFGKWIYRILIGLFEPIIAECGIDVWS